MIDEIKYDVSCPVCQRQAEQALVCTGCGWLFTAFSSRPDEKFIEKMKHLKEVKVKDLDVLNRIKSELEQVSESIEDLKPRHRHLKNMYEESEARWEQYKEQQADIRRKMAEMMNTDKLTSEVAALESAKHRLEARLPPDEDISGRSPAVTFRCKYDSDNKTLEVEVIQIHDLSVQKISDFMVGIVFSDKPIQHYSEADIIVSTVVIREMTNLDLGAKTFLKLQYEPPPSMKFRQVMHLSNHNLSIFSIE